MVAKGELFFKVHLSAIESGLIRELGDKRWTTLTVLASFMNENGECFPSQELIAQRLGVRRDTANQRIQSLLEFQFHGKPVVTLIRKDGGWSKRNNVYRIEPASQLAIFKGEIEVADVLESSNNDMLDKSNMLENPNTHMLDKPNTDMLAKTNTDPLDNPNTNKNYYNNSHNNYIKKEQPSATPTNTINNLTLKSNGNSYDVNIISDSIDIGDSSINSIDTVNTHKAVRSFPFKRGMEAKLGLEAELDSGDLKNSNDVIKYFCQKYQEHYSVKYTVSQGKDNKLIKDKLLANYTPEQIKAIIDTVFVHFDFRWANDKYPRPHIGALTSFLANEALAIIAAEDKKLADIKRQMEAPKPTAEEIIARMRRGLSK